MGKRKRDPHSPEAVAAVYRHIESMSKEELEAWIDKLSQAPNDGYEPWSEENWPRERELLQSSNGAAPAADPCPSAEPERAAKQD